MGDSHIYVVLSKTPTGIGSVVRRATGVEFNHASLSFDKGLHEMYAFARPRYHAPILGRLVHETTGMYTRDGFYTDVPIKVYAIPVTDTQRDQLRGAILGMAVDRNCLYNFPSLLSFPLFHGVQRDGMYTCAEFVAWCLRYTSVDLDLPTYTYTAKELLEQLGDYCIYQGPMLEFAELVPAPDGFFSGITPFVVGASAVALISILGRIFHMNRREE